MNEKSDAKIVNVEIVEHPTGIFMATSPDLKGFLVAKQTLAAVQDAIPQAIADLTDGHHIHPA